MSTYNVTAIIRSELLEQVELNLQELDIRGVSISTVKGYGESTNLAKHDWTVRHARLDIFASHEMVDRIVGAIRSSACTNAAGDGIIAVTPVDRVVRIRTGAPFEARRPVPRSLPAVVDARPRVPLFGVALAILIGVVVLCGFFAPIEHRLHLLSLALLLTLALTVLIGAYRAVSPRALPDDMSSERSAPVDPSANGDVNAPSQGAPS